MFATGNRWCSLFILSLGDGCLVLVIGGAVCSSCPRGGNSSVTRYRDSNPMHGPFLSEHFSFL